MFDFSCTTHHILLGISCILNSAAIVYNVRTIYKLRRELDDFYESFLFKRSRQ